MRKSTTSESQLVNITISGTGKTTLRTISTKRTGGRTYSIMKTLYCITLLLGAFVSAVLGGHKLNEAVFARNPTRIKEIIESGEEDVNHKIDDDEGMSALYAAAYIGNLEMMKLLLNDYNADPMNGDSRGYSPIDMLSSRSMYEPVELLMEAAAENIISNMLNERDGFSPLHRAAKNNDQQAADIIQIMIEKGADPNTKSLPSSKKPGVTPLHIATEHGNNDMVSRLVTMGADVESADANGNTVLHIAAKNGNDKMMELLLDMGANVKAKNLANETPFDDVIRNNNLSSLSKKVQDALNADL